MFRIKDTSKLEEMGFKKDEETGDYVIKEKINDSMKLLFKIYRGSDYLRHAKTGYIIEDQLKLVYEWSKRDYIYWEE